MLKPFLCVFVWGVKLKTKFIENIGISYPTQGPIYKFILAVPRSVFTISGFFKMTIKDFSFVEDTLFYAFTKQQNTVFRTKLE